MRKRSKVLKWWFFNFRIVPFSRRWFRPSFTFGFGRWWR